jgi:hypothetical protein
MDFPAETAAWIRAKAWRDFHHELYQDRPERLHQCACQTDLVSETRDGAWSVGLSLPTTIKARKCFEKGRPQGRSGRTGMKPHNQRRNL